MKMGWLARGSSGGALRVVHDGGAPLPARTTLTLDAAAVAHAVETRQPVVLLFENGDPRLPIVVGLVQPDPAAALLGTLLAQPVKTGQAPAEVAPASVTRPGTPVDARVDGKRVIIEGQDEVTLKCGEASITLRRDGKMILRGAYVETTSKGVNRIRGGSVKIN